MTRYMDFSHQRVRLEDLEGKIAVDDFKLHKSLKPRFYKDWLFEAVWWIFDKFDPSYRRYVTEPNQRVLEFVLGRFDPDPNAGFFSGKRRHAARTAFFVRRRLAVALSGQTDDTKKDIVLRQWWNQMYTQSSDPLTSTVANMC